MVESIQTPPSLEVTVSRSYPQPHPPIPPRPRSFLPVLIDTLHPHSGNRQAGNRAVDILHAPLAASKDRIFHISEANLNIFTRNFPNILRRFLASWPLSSPSILRVFVSSCLRGFFLHLFRAPRAFVSSKIVPIATCPAHSGNTMKMPRTSLANTCSQTPIHALFSPHLPLVENGPKAPTMHPSTQSRTLRSPLPFMEIDRWTSHRFHILRSPLPLWERGRGVRGKKPQGGEG